jgi:LPXTG-site transpeptidase (sortase) family protein
MTRDTKELSVFSTAFFVVFFPSLLAVAMLGAPLAPKVVADTPLEAYSEAPESTPRRVEAPLRVVIPSVGIDASIENPTGTSIATLDALLAKGAVRYPLSGLLGEEKNMFLFGHSSFLPNVRNPAFQTFNHLERVQRGDEIHVNSTDTAYTYRVLSVEKVDAEEALVSLEEEGKLVLSTCNSFGQKEERFVVTAEFVGSHPLESA